jgi:hypothetical protein
MAGSCVEFVGCPAGDFHEGPHAHDGLVPSQRALIDGDSAVLAVAAQEPSREQAAGDAHDGA